MKNKIFAVIFCAFYSAVSFNVEAQDFDKAKMDSLFARIEAVDMGMGSFSIYKDGKEVYAKANGYADVKRKLPNDAATKFRIGSISKTFTATVIMQLVDDGKLTLDTRLGKYFPDIRNAKDITVGQMLGHRSGITNFTNAKDYMARPITRKDLVGKIAKLGSAFEPDARAEYSNSNYVLLSLIAEKVEDSDFAKIVLERVIKPCNLENTYYGGKIKTSDHEALSYGMNNGWQPETETDMSVPLGAGAMVSTSSDLNRFLYCLFNKELVSEASLDKMTTMRDGFGLGLFEFPLYGKTFLGHNGGIDGFESNAAYNRAEKVSVAYLSNGVSMPLNDIVLGAMSIYYGKDYELPTFEKAVEISEKDLQQYNGNYKSPSFPLDIKIFVKDGKLMAQATGQPSFALESLGNHRFRYIQAGLSMEFDPKTDTMMFKQGGGEYELKR